MFAFVGKRQGTGAVQNAGAPMRPRLPSWTAPVLMCFSELFTSEGRARSKVRLRALSPTPPSIVPSFHHSTPPGRIRDWLVGRVTPCAPSGRYGRDGRLTTFGGGQGTARPTNHSRMRPQTKGIQP